jgi:hypothetical protein
MNRIRIRPLIPELDLHFGLAVVTAAIIVLFVLA